MIVFHARPRSPLLPGRVKIISGSHGQQFSVAGYSVADVRRSLQQVLNIAPEALALVNGVEVGSAYRLRTGDVLEFVRPRGCKGGNDDRDEYFLRSPDAQLKLNEILVRLRRIEEQLVESNKLQAPPKDFYSVEDFGELVDLAPYTVREHCRLGRLRAQKTSYGRGESQEWRIPHAELVRYRNFGLLPFRKN
jgi:hypothetical protein